MTESVAQDSEPCGAPELERLPLATMGKADTWIRRQAAAFRNSLERAVRLANGGRLVGDNVVVGGSVGVAAASRIATACTAMRRAMQVERRLADEGEKLGVGDWALLADRSVRFRETIDRCLAALGLDAAPVPADLAPAPVEIIEEVVTPAARGGPDEAAGQLEQQGNLTMGAAHVPRGGIG